MCGEVAWASLTPCEGVIPLGGASAAPLGAHNEYMLGRRTIAHKG